MKPVSESGSVAGTSGTTGISDRLRRLRVENQMSMKQVADRIGVPLSTYRDWEYGKSIRGEPYPELAALYGVSVHELITGRTAEKSEIVKALLDAREAVE